LIVIEGIRRSGKTYLVDTIKNKNNDVIFYKDRGVMYAMKNNIDVDDYVIGRDLTYAQLFSNTKPDIFNNIVFDRQYLSSYVYGQYYRNKYNKVFWRDHIRKVENLYESAGILDQIKILFIELDESDFEKIANMNRNKDHLENNNIVEYKEQYYLYKEALSITKANVSYIKAFQDSEKINKRFNDIRS